MMNMMWKGQRQGVDKGDGRGQVTLIAIPRPPSTVDSVLVLRGLVQQPNGIFADVAGYCHRPIQQEPFWAKEASW